MISKPSYKTAKHKLLYEAEVPKETRTYKPVSHAQLVDLTLEGIHKAGFILEKEEYSSAKDGVIGNGRYIIKNVADGEMKLQVGWQNSYNKSLSLKFAIGTHIIICENGCVSGDYGSFRKKHMSDIQTFAPSTISEYIQKAGDAFRNIQNQRDRMKEIAISKRTASEIIGRMFIEESLIYSTQLNIIKREIETPTFDYGAPGSLWELYQHTTFAMKEIHPSLWMDSHIDVHDFFVGQIGKTPMVPKIETPVSSYKIGTPYTADGVEDVIVI